MKKVLALVLAIMMLATTAFAATGELTNPTKEDTTSPRGDWLPGKTIKIMTPASLPPTKSCQPPWAMFFPLMLPAQKTSWLLRT